MLKKVAKVIIYICGILGQIPFHLIFLISFFIPRSKKIWVFGCWEGDKFRGNSKYLYLYALKYHPEVKSIWITKNSKVFDLLTKNNKPVLKAFDYQSYYYCARAKFAFVTHGIIDINEYATGGQIIINSSHSIYPIKDMKRGLPRSILSKLYVILRFPYGYLGKPTYAVTASEFTLQATKHHYNISESKIITTGVPKTDYLLSNSKDDFDLESEQYKSKLNCFICEGQKLFLFLPTWRGDKNFSIFDFGFNVLKLQKFLEKINAKIIFNFHPAHINKVFPDFTQYNNIEIYSYKGDEMNQILRKANLLITDYSALFADFLLFDKPIIFANFDHDKYVKEKGLFVDYNTLPGIKAQDWNEIYLHLKEIFIYNIDSDLGTDFGKSSG